MMRVLAAALVAFGLTAASAVASVEDQIRERIAPVGKVCLQGEECGSAAAASSEESSDGPRAGDVVYESACTACHATGAAGAPILGDADAWSDRIDKGMETLVDHAINGFQGMPAKGGCSSCSDEEIEAAVEHMVDAVN
ncbi:c-type cytochrome [Marinobacter sp.]|uniref:c-type cytochrome n=1 Tax=Marinobacter sp. TaxID=50741 RepID=UPI00356229F7